MKGHWPSSISARIDRDPSKVPKLMGYAKRSSFTNQNRASTINHQSLLPNNAEL